MSLRGKYRKTRRRELLLRIKYLTFEEQSSFGTRLEQIKSEIVKLRTELEPLERSISDGKRM
jgi:hypothetical protein